MKQPFQKMRENVALYNDMEMLLLHFRGFRLIDVQHYSLLDLSDCRFSIFFRNVYIHMEDNGILVKYAYSLLKMNF